MRESVTSKRVKGRAFVLRCSTTLAALALLSGMPLQAEEPAPFEITVDGRHLDDALPSAEAPAIPAGTTNSAGESAAPGTLPDLPAQSAEPGAATPSLSKVDIQVKYNGLDVKPILNVSTVPPRTTYEGGETIKFLASFNYPAFVERAEIRIYEAGGRSESDIVDTIPVSPLGGAEWVMPSGGADRLDYMVRVYDSQGRFDETTPLPLVRAAQLLKDREAPNDAVAPGYSEDHTARRSIDVAGGSVTVYGKHVPLDHDVTIMGEPVPIDGSGGFVVQRILPPGQTAVEISVEKDGQVTDYSREITVPDSEWFYVGLADLTAGYRFQNHIEAVRPGEFDDIYSRGRVAFYVKGKIKGRYILTASADTTEVQLKNIFKGLDDKNPREFLNRLDPDDYYPVYGDDSTATEDAPTRGKFYIKFERGPSHVMWGNFKSNITNTQFLRNERALYGASGVYRSDSVAKNGEARTAVDAYAALPGTVPQRDLLRGTGGSAYFLKHQDITEGSETVSIEVRNAITGFVIERRSLTYGTDFTLDYVQGVLILRQPLQSTSRGGTENFLTVSYEYSPGATDVDGYVAGGRAQQWLGNHVRVGVSGQHEKTDSANQKIYGADVHVEAAPGTYVEAEVARSQGPGFGNSYSPDGGLTIQDNGTAGAVNRKAYAYRTEAHADLTDVTHGRIEGKVQARYEHYQEGFSSLDVQANEKKTAWGIEGEVKPSERVQVAVAYGDLKTGAKTIDREGKAKVNVEIDKHWAVEPYARYLEREREAKSEDDEGRRLDLGTKLIYTWNEDHNVYVFGQGSVIHAGEISRDNRVGFGGKTRVTDEVSLSGEISEGNEGVDAQAMLTYEPSEDSRYYIGYRLDAERDNSSNWPFELIGSDLGTIVAGSRVKMTDNWAAYSEDNYDVFGQRKSLTQSYGVTYTPDESWTIGGGVEIGTVYDNTIDSSTGKKNPDFDRKAYSISLGYKDGEGISARLKGEARYEDSEDNERDLDSYLLSANVGVKMSKDWRALGSLDAVFTDATSAIKDGDYMEGSFGFAYRPANSDRLNALLKYTYLLDEPGQDQVTLDGNKNGDSQRSHIFNADVSYDLIPQLTLGAKYGFRIGDTRERVSGADWERSSAHLGILRADVHIVHEWDALIEGRMLWSPTTDTTDYGLLVALYRQLGDNFKIGVGYNFGKFSDDLRDLTLDDQGVFLNIVGKI